MPKLDDYVKTYIADLVIGNAQKQMQIDELTAQLAKFAPPAPPEAPKTDA